MLTAGGVYNIFSKPYSFLFLRFFTFVFPFSLAGLSGPHLVHIHAVSQHKRRLALLHSLQVYMAAAVYSSAGR